MIIPDINLLIYAYNGAAPAHVHARAWLEQLMRDQTPVAIPWVVSLGFVRIMTHPSILVDPLHPSQALDILETWYGRSHVLRLEPGPRHLSILRGLLSHLGVAGNLTTDSHLAAMAIEYKAELHTNDTDFRRFHGLNWHNPLDV